MTREHSPQEAGLGFAVRPAKGEFIGREALEVRPVERRLACLTLDDPEAIALGSEPVFAAGTDECIGYITSADQGYTIGATIAYAWVPARFAEAGQRLELEYFGKRFAATVRCEPLFDPEMAHIKR
nr:glycine cleavage T C-terminal barrel domain-containing protein [Halotalea alkalilenta]